MFKRLSLYLVQLPPSEKLRASNLTIHPLNWIDAPYTSSPWLDLTTPPCLVGLSLLILGIHNTCLLRILQPYYWFRARFELAEDLDIARGVRRGRTCVDLSNRNGVCLTTFDPTHHTPVLNASFTILYSYYGNLPLLLSKLAHNRSSMFDKTKGCLLS